MAERTLTTNKGEVHVTPLNAHALRAGTTFVGLENVVEVVGLWAHRRRIDNTYIVEIETSDTYDYKADPINPPLTHKGSRYVFDYNESVPVVVGGQAGGGMRGGSR